MVIQHGVISGLYQYTLSEFRLGRRHSSSTGAGYSAMAYIRAAVQIASARPHGGGRPPSKAQCADHFKLDKKRMRLYAPKDAKAQRRRSL